MEPTDNKPKKLVSRWWKIGFFVLLIMFEICREVAVIGVNQAPMLATIPSASSIGGLVSAGGRWVRTDGGTPLTPSMTHIRCTRESNTCIEANVTVSDGYVSEPSIDTYDASFTDDAVSYDSDYDCVRYRVRIDLRQEKVFSIRERKNVADGCGGYEPKISMMLSNGYQETDSPLKGHFVPIFSLLRGLF